MNNQLLAQQLTVGGATVNGPLKGIGTVGDLISTLLSFLFPLAAVILALIIIWGGYDFLLSGGEADKIKSGKAKITYGLIGFVLLTLSFIAAKLIGSIFGLGGGII
jgi:hypothetical protein